MKSESYITVCSANTRYTRLIYCRPCCNLLIHHNRVTSSP